MLVEIGFVVLDLLLDSALYILQVVWLHRRRDRAFSIKIWLLS